ncbi:MAG TPA: serine hydrolase [Verrucomicrobiae bacterium]|nr:serine hydrolase [Verrucomicrobiae bacterium]
MKKLLFMSLLASANLVSAETISLPRSTPEAQGISSLAILDFLETADKNFNADSNAVHSFMLVRHGHVVAEGWWSPYDAKTRHKMFSLSKSFTSTAVGLAIADGKLSLNDPVISFFPDDTSENPGDNLKAMRVRDLLIMSSGQNADTIAQLGNVMGSFGHTNVSLTKAFLNAPVEVKPGTLFIYNTPGTYMLSAIVQKATGEKVFDYLRPRLFKPLGIENATWDESPQGVTLGGIGLNIRTEDIAKLGQLYLQKGNWNGKQLIPAAWVAAATTKQTSNGSNPASDWEQGYGYQFWRARHDIFRGDGLYGQFCIVMPEQDAVVAMTGGTRDMAGVMNLIWDKLLPAMQTNPLPANDGAYERLKAKLASLTLLQPKGSATSEMAGQVSGKIYSFPPNIFNIDSVKFDFNGENTTLMVRSRGKEHKISIGNQHWEKGERTDFVAGADWRVADAVEQSVAASGAWTADDTYTAKFAYCETPLAVRFTFRFAGEKVLLLNVDYSVTLGDMKSGMIVGETR